MAERRFLLRLRAEEHEALRLYAQATGTSMNEAASTAIRSFLSGAARAKLVDAKVDDIRRRYRTVLDKLADL